MMMRRAIPYYKPGGKLCFFAKEDLDAWLKRVRVKSQDEIDGEEFVNIGQLCRVSVALMKISSDFKAVEDARKHLQLQSSNFAIVIFANMKLFHSGILTEIIIIHSILIALTLIIIALTFYRNK